MTVLVAIVEQAAIHWLQELGWIHIDGLTLTPDEDQLLMRHCAWWLSLGGLDASTNAATVRVQIPRAQRFDVAALTGIMERLGQGGVP